MANTFTQAYAHIIFSTAGRKPLLKKEWRNEVFGYMANTITNHKQKSIIVNGVEDHVHMLIGFKADIALSNVVRDVKRSSSLFIKSKGYVPSGFGWQSGFGFVTHSHKSLDTVYEYIENQERHHARKSFEEEYLAFLKLYGIDYDMRNVFG
jgi:REP element-mobilizing transposase RayT